MCGFWYGCFNCFLEGVRNSPHSEGSIYLWKKQSWPHRQVQNGALICQKMRIRVAFPQWQPRSGLNQCGYKQARCCSGLPGVRPPPRPCSSKCGLVCCSDHRACFLPQDLCLCHFFWLRVLLLQSAVSLESVRQFARGCIADKD